MKITELSLEQTGIEELPWSICNLSELRKLNLGGCSCLKYFPEILDKMKITELSLRRSGIEELPRSICNLSELRTLDLSYCSSLKHFPEILDKMKITELSLVKTGIEELPRSICNLSELRKLDLGGCSSLKYFPEILDKMKITELSLWGTGIEELPRSICNLSELRKLDLGGYSSLKYFPEILDKMKITELSLCGTGIEELPRSICNLSELRKLNLRGCSSLKYFPEILGEMKIIELYLNCTRIEELPQSICNLSELIILDLGGCVCLKYFPEILDKMKIWELYLGETKIEKLPWSICNLSKLRMLVIKQNWSAIEIPDSIFLLPEIQEIRVDSGSGKLMSCNSKEAQEEAMWSKQCPNRVEFDLPHCNISDDILRTYLSRFMNVKHLNLSGNDFTILPAWMKECHFLETLLLNECKHLREVEGIPPRIRHLEAINCVLLSSESKSLLLSEELHGAPGRYNYDLEEEEPCFFCVPSGSIPKWFEHRRKGASISFWFRNSFPTLCLCFLLQSGFCDFFVRVEINGELPSYDNIPSFSEGRRLCADDHLVVYYLEEGHLCKFERERLHLEDRWYHAKVYVVDSSLMVIEESGMYVIKQLCEMEDITFANPYHQTLDSTWGDQEASLVDVDLNTTQPMLPWKEQACDTSRNQGNSIEDDEWLSLRLSWETPSYDESANHKADYFDEGMVIEESGMEVNEQLCHIEDITFNNPYQDSTWGDQEQAGTRIEEKEIAVNKKRRLMGGDNFVSSSTAFICPINQDDNEATPQVPFVKACEIINNNQELQQQKDVTSTNVEQVSKSFEDARKAKGKEIVIYDDNLNE